MRNYLQDEHYHPFLLSHELVDISNPVGMILVHVSATVLDAQPVSTRLRQSLQ